MLDRDDFPYLAPFRSQNRRVNVRFTAADGTEWTVWDVTWSNKKHHRRPHGDPTATERVFVNAGGVKRAYKFKPSYAPSYGRPTSPAGSSGVVMAGSTARTVSVNA